MTEAEIYIHRCLELAQLGAGKVSPNPLVGCVIVCDQKIIGEGWHQQFGGPHAEVMAIESVREKELLKKSTLYVNLEPCAHTGKTSPCTHLILDSGIPRVVMGCVDPNPLVAGKGIQFLQEKGVSVQTGVLEEECTQLNRRFFKWVLKKQPYVILKWAQTQNGFIAPDASKMSQEQFEEERHITGFVVQKLVHKWRTEEDVILVGTNTALLDNPALNARAWSGRNPVRAVLDRNLRLPADLKLFDNTQTTLVFNAKQNLLKEKTEWIQIDFEGNWLESLFHELFKRNLQSLVIEGGRQLLSEIIQRGYWDEAIVFYSPKQIKEGISAPPISGKIILQDELDGVRLTQILNP